MAAGAASVCSSNMHDGSGPHLQSCSPPSRCANGARTHAPVGHSRHRTPANAAWVRARSPARSDARCSMPWLPLHAARGSVVHKLCYGLTDAAADTHAESGYLAV